MFQRWARLHLVLTANAGSARVTYPGGTFEGMRGQGNNWGLVLCGRLEFLKRGQERLFVKAQLGCSKRPQHFGDARTMGWPPRAAAEVKWSLKDKPCALQRVKSEKGPKLLGEAQKTMSKSEILVMYAVEAWFCIIWLVTVPWFLSLKVRKYLINLDFTGAHGKKTLNFWKRDFRIL